MTPSGDPADHAFKVRRILDAAGRDKVSMRRKNYESEEKP
jgi:hypothetical protein